MNSRANYFLRKNKLHLMWNTLRHFWIPMLGIVVAVIFAIYQVFQLFPSAEHFSSFFKENLVYFYGITVCFCFVRIYCIKNPVFKVNAATLLHFHNTVYLTKLLQKKRYISFLFHVIISFCVSLCIHGFGFYGRWGLDFIKLLFFFRSSWLIAWIFYHEVGTRRIISGLIFPLMLPPLVFEHFFFLIACGGFYIALLYYIKRFLTLNYPKYYERMYYIDQIEAAQSRNNTAEMARIAEENRPSSVTGIRLQHFHPTLKTALMSKAILDIVRTQKQIWVCVIAFIGVGWCLVRTSILQSIGFHIDPSLISMIASILTMAAFSSLFQTISNQIQKMIGKKKAGLDLPYTNSQIFWAYLPVAMVINLILVIVLDTLYGCFSVSGLGFYIIVNAAYLLVAYSTVYSQRGKGFISGVSGIGLLICIFFRYMI